MARAAEELVRHARVSDETWQALSERYSRVELMELVGLVGTYMLVAMSTNTFGIEVEDDEIRQGFMERRDYVERERGTAVAPT